ASNYKPAHDQRTTTGIGEPLCAWSAPAGGTARVRGTAAEQLGGAGARAKLAARHRLVSSRRSSVPATASTKRETAPAYSGERRRQLRRAGREIADTTEARIPIPRRERSRRLEGASAEGRLDKAAFTRGGPTLRSGDGKTRAGRALSRAQTFRRRGT